MSGTPRHRFGRALLVCFAALVASIPLALPVFSDPIPEPPRVARSQIDAGTPERLIYNATGTGALTDLPAITGSRLLASDASGLPTALAALDANRVLRSDGSGYPIALSPITADRALISDGSGYPTNSSVTATELGYVSGVTSSVQTQLDAISVREQLTGDTTFYVATTGSDSNDCRTGGNACLTVQHVIGVIRDTIDLAGYNATIDVENGTYTSGATCSYPFWGSGTVSIVGDTTTPTNVVFDGAATVSATNNCQIRVRGIQVSTSGNGIVATNGGRIFVDGNVDFDAMSGQIHMLASSQGSILVTSSYTISGGADQHAATQLGGYIQIAGVTVTLSGTPAFTIFAATRASGMSIHSVTFSGSATGQRYFVSLNGTINTFGAGATYLPGNAAGSGATGGNYD